jgi:hypothetical protein
MHLFICLKLNHNINYTKEWLYKTRVTCDTSAIQKYQQKWTIRV